VAYVERASLHPMGLFRFKYCEKNQFMGQDFVNSRIKERRIGMKKLLFIILASFVFGTLAFAQETPTGSREKSIEELQWQSEALRNEYLYLQERMKNVQVEWQKVQQELAAKKARQAKESVPEKKEKKQKK
jgi:hypothetical protein